MAGHFNYQIGSYTSVHDYDKPSPAVLIALLARRILADGKTLTLTRSVDAHSIRMTVAELGAYDTPIVVSRARVEDLIMIWEAIKAQHPNAQVSPIDRGFIEQFVNTARSIITTIDRQRRP